MNRRTNWMVTSWMVWVFTGVTLLAGCASTEQASEAGEEVELESPEQQTFYPEWFDPGTAGAVAGADLVGYGRAISHDEQRSLETARENAEQALRYRVDQLLEEEGESLEASWRGDGSMHEAFRNAVASLDLSDVAWRTETVQHESRATVVVAEARIASSVVADQLVATLGLEPVRSLFDPSGEPQSGE